MIQHFTIHVQHEMDDNAPVIQITDPVEKENIKHRIIQEDKIWNAKIAAYPDQNSYDNDDYLFIADLIQDIRQLHRRMHCPKFIGHWIQGHSDIPGIHLFFTSNRASMFDIFGNETPHDEFLNMGIEKKSDAGYHRLKVDYPWLRRYIIFLQKEAGKSGQQDRKVHLGHSRQSGSRQS